MFEAGLTQEQMDRATGMLISMFAAVYTQGALDHASNPESLLQPGSKHPTHEMMAQAIDAAIRATALFDDKLGDLGIETPDERAANARAN